MIAPSPHARRLRAAIAACGLIATGTLTPAATLAQAPGPGALVAAAASIKRDEVLPQVQVDLSAVTTLATLQLRGYALLPD